MAERGILAVVSGFAGSGKGTIMQELLSRYDNYALSISATTRAPRAGEEHGRHYFFVSTEEFERMIREDALLEHARYVSNYYGTPKAYVEEKLSEGKDVILEIEAQGALLVREKYPDAVLLFVMPPDVNELYHRLKTRGTETEEVIRKRMARAAEEAELIAKYDYLVINDDLDECVARVHMILQASHERTGRQTERLNTIKEQFKLFLKEEK